MAVSISPSAKALADGNFGKGSCRPLSRRQRVSVQRGTISPSPGGGVSAWSLSGSLTAASAAFHSCVLPASARTRHVSRRGYAAPRAGRVQTDGQVVDRWWEKNVPPNMSDIHSTQEFVEALSEAGEKLVVVEFFGTWCGSCRALFPKLCKLAAEYPEVLFYKIDLDANKPLCKSLNIRVLPFFHFYRGASGRLDAFPASLSKLQRLKDALAMHSTDRCSLGPPAGPEQVLHPDLVPEAASAAPPVPR